MLQLSWRYRWGCLKLLLLQGLLLGTALAAVALSGLGIDAVRYYAGVEPKQPPYPLGWQPPSSWTGIQTVGAIAGAILIVSLFRGWLNYIYAVASGMLIHK